MKTKCRLAIVLAGLVSVAAWSSAAENVIGTGSGITAIDLGLGAPPTSIGGFWMNPLGLDGRTVGDEVLGITFSDGRPVVFSPGLLHYQVGNGWETWSHSYKGDVYGLDEVFWGNVLMLLLPPETRAFYFYLEPNFFDPAGFDITATGGSGTLSLVGLGPVEGMGGAKGFGFYTADPGPVLSEISITGVETWPAGYGVGQFGINNITGGGPGVPDGGATIALLALSMAAVATAWTRSRTLR